MTPAEQLAATIDRKPKAVEKRPSVLCNLAKVRLAVGLSQTAVADHFNISPVQLCRWESGKMFPAMKTVLRLARFYGKPVEELWTLPSDEASEPEEKIT